MRIGAERQQGPCVCTGAKRKGNNLTFKFKCDMVSRPIVELLGRKAAGLILRREGEAAKTSAWLGHVNIRCSCDGKTDEEIHAMGDRIRQISNVLDGLDCNDAMRTLGSPECYELLSLDDAEKFEPAFNQWKSALEQTSSTK